MTIEIIKVIIGICKEGSIGDCTPDHIQFHYTYHIARDREKVQLHRAGFNVVSHGNSINVLIPA